MRSIRLARRLIRLYPRRWRERYGDEVRALLADTTVTPTVIFDLLIGASREWARALTAVPDPPVSMDGEIWRGWRRAAIGALAIGGIAWFVAGELLRRQVLSEDYGWILTSGLLYAAARTLIVQIKYSRLQYRGRLGFTPPPSSERMIAVGIGRTEFWICILLMLVSTSVSWTIQMRHLWEIAIRWTSLFVYLNLLQGSTGTALARRQWLVQRAIAEREARRIS